MSVKHEANDKTPTCCSVNSLFFFFKLATLKSFTPMIKTNVFFLSFTAIWDTTTSKKCQQMLSKACDNCIQSSWMKTKSHRCSKTLSVDYRLCDIFIWTKITLKILQSMHLQISQGLNDCKYIWKRTFNGYFEMHLERWRHSQSLKILKIHFQNRLKYSTKVC